MTVVGTRPEIIRLSRIFHELDRHTKHILVHTGQNYDFELNEIFFKDMELRKPDYILSSAGSNAIETIAQVLLEVDKLLEKEKPNAMLVLGDTNSCLSLLAAKRRKIPTFHMEAGNRCFDMRVPEEINRRMIDHIADINLPYSAIARDYLLREGLQPDTIIKTGSPMNEVLSFYRSKIDASDILLRLNLKKYKFFLVSVHREENIEPEKNFSQFIEIIDCLAKTYNLPVIISTHPRTQKRIDAAEIKFSENINFLKPLSFTDYNKLQLMAKVSLSDSGTINEESSLLNFPALNLREAHERPEGMEEAAVMMVGLNPDRILQGINILENQTREENRSLGIVTDYISPNISKKIVRIIHSYTDYVNRVVWKKY